MDLTSFTQKKNDMIKSKIIIDNKEVKIIENEDHSSIILKTKEALEKYSSQMFMAPTTSIITESNDEAEKFFRLAIESGTEGLMFKSLSSEYKAGVRTGSITKLKETKEDLDLVIVGAEYGKGKRAGFYSSFYVAIRDSFSEDESFLRIGKVSSGIKELEDSQSGVNLQTLTSLLTPLKISEDRGVVKFEPKIIIQVRYQELQKSTAYESGYALRFPRIIMLRSDKALDEITSIDEIKNYL